MTSKVHGQSTIGEASGGSFGDEYDRMYTYNRYLTDADGAVTGSASDETYYRSHTSDKGKYEDTAQGRQETGKQTTSTLSRQGLTIDRWDELYYQNYAPDELMETGEWHFQSKTSSRSTTEVDYSPDASSSQSSSTSDTKEEHNKVIELYADFGEGSEVERRLAERLEEELQSTTKVTDGAASGRERYWKQTTDYAADPTTVTLSSYNYNVTWPETSSAAMAMGGGGDEPGDDEPMVPAHQEQQANGQPTPGGGVEGRLNTIKVDRQGAAVGSPPESPTTSGLDEIKAERNGKLRAGFTPRYFDHQRAANAADAGLRGIGGPVNTARDLYELGTQERSLDSKPLTLGDNAERVVEQAGTLGWLMAFLRRGKGSQAAAVVENAVEAADDVKDGRKALGGSKPVAAVKSAAKTAPKTLPIPNVTDPKLKNYVNDLYKGAKGPNPIGTGSTADAVRNELRTGLPTHGRFHSIKAKEVINGLTNWLRKNPNASHHDRLVAQSLLDDLKAALGGN
ncbi:hypothetical protein [Botrimarina colliarenosi]|uniref:hypothetical protein n=1 Tax=Botrimarina colliarenosi TaxID=2528001 RepID=UPI0018D43C50|nr:hypothetical protein [Botrimarina colliarenosi]